MRICMLCPYFPPLTSGAGLQAISLAKELRRKNIHVFFIALKLGSLPEYEVIDGFEVYRVDVKEGSNITADLMNWSSLIGMLLKKKRQYDIIHCHGLTFYEAICGLIGKITKKPVIAKLTLAGTEVHLNGRVTGFLHKSLIKRFDKLVPISRELIRELEEINMNMNKVEYIQNGVDLKRFKLPSEEEKARLKRKLNIKGKKVAIFVGVIDPRKGIHHLVEAWNQCCKNLPGATLVILGPKPDSENRWSDQKFYEDFIGKLDEAGDGSIQYFGKVKNVEDFLKASDMLVLPSKAEGLPNVLLEGMACNLPIVCTRIGGNVDLVREGVNGYLFDFGDTERLQKAISRLMDNEDERVSFGNESRKIIEEGYSIETVASRYEKLYRDLLGRATGAIH